MINGGLLNIAPSESSTIGGIRAFVAKVQPLLGPILKAGFFARPYLVDVRQA
jgi:hypothetical protein